MATTYVVERPAGPWAVGTELTDEELKAHPFSQKFLNSGSVVKSDGTRKTAADNTEKIADLQAQIAKLQAELSTLQGTPTEPNAPANVTFDVDQNDPPTQKEAEATRAEGKEVIQPQPGDPVLGEVAPGEAAKGKK